MLNPTLYRNTYNNFRLIFQAREINTQEQIVNNPHSSLLTSTKRIDAIFNHFYSNYNSNLNFNFNEISLPFPRSLSKNVFYLGFLLILMITGIVSEIVYAFKGDKNKLVILVTFFVIIITMVFYLNIEWNRYYIQLVFFIIFYQMLGVLFYVKLIRKLLLLNLFRQN